MGIVASPDWLCSHSCSCQQVLQRSPAWSTLRPSSHVDIAQPILTHSGSLECQQVLRPSPVWHTTGPSPMHAAIMFSRSSPALILTGGNHSLSGESLGSLTKFTPRLNLECVGGALTQPGMTHL